MSYSLLQVKGSWARGCRVQQCSQESYLQLKELPGSAAKQPELIWGRTRGPQAG